MRKCRSFLSLALFGLLFLAVIFICGKSLMNYAAAKRLKNAPNRLVCDQQVSLRSYCEELYDQSKFHSCGAAIGYTRSEGGIDCRLENEKRFCSTSLSVDSCIYSRLDRHLYHYCIRNDDGIMIHYHQPMITVKGGSTKNTVESFGLCGEGVKAKRTRHLHITVSSLVYDASCTFATRVQSIQDPTLSICLQHYAESMSPLFECSDVMLNGTGKEDL
jgi:hypothetical protein